METQTNILTDTAMSRIASELRDIAATPITLKFIAGAFYVIAPETGVQRLADYFTKYNQHFDTGFSQPDQSHYFRLATGYVGESPGSITLGANKRMGLVADMIRSQGGEPVHETYGETREIPV